MVILIVSACLHEHMGLVRVETPCSPPGSGLAPRTGVRKSDTHHGGEKTLMKNALSANICKFTLPILDPKPPLATQLRHSGV